MWLVGVRDLQFRRRRFLIAVIATSVVFSMTVLMSGLSKGLDAEVDRIVASYGDVDRVRDAPGARAAAPMLVARDTIGRDSLKDVNVLGYTPGGAGAPVITEGRPATKPGEIVIDSHLAASVGDTLEVSGRPERVVGIAPV